MNFKKAPNIPVFSLLLAALVFTQGCVDSSSSDTENTIVNATERGGASGLAAALVNGVPAFTWDYDDPELAWGPCPEFFPEGCELAVVQGNPAEPNADVLLKLAPNTTVDDHWHTSTERMVLLAGQMTVDYEGQEPVNLMPGTYAYGPAGLPHVAHCGDDGDCILFIAFEDPVDAIPVTDAEAPGSEESAFTLTTNGAEFVDCPPFMPESCGLAVLQGNPEEHNADVFFRLKPGTKVPKHWHTSAERMVLLSGQLRVNYQGQAPVIMNPFTYAYGPPKLPHDTICREQDDDCILFIAFEEPVDAIDIRGGNLPRP